MKQIIKKVITYVLIFLAIYFIRSFILPVNVKAAELNQNYQMVVVGNEIPTTLYVPGDNTALISKIEYTSMPNLTEDYTLDNYLILEVCTNGPMSNISMSKINNNSYFSSNDIVVYNTKKSCKTANNYDGTVYYLQLRVDKWNHVQSSDGYLVQGNLSIKSSWGYYTLYTFTNAFTSQEDYLTSYENQQKLENAIGNLGDKQDQTNEKLDETNKNLEDINSSLTDDTPPSLSGLENSAGWLKPGPVDSILNLPLSLLNNLNNNFSKTCTPIDLTLPYVNSTLTLPCISTIYENIGISSYVNGVGVIAAAFILFSYLMHLYKWVDDTLSLRENTWQDWGGV